MSHTICPACLQPLPNPSLCPQCGWYRGISLDGHYLPPGTRVNAPYQVARVLGHGGFGITYLGWDANLQIKVAIKEYMPREFAHRDPQSGRVLANSAADAAQFQAGLNRFLDEARILAKFQQHPGIVSVLSFFPAFGTGYMVMEYVEGQTLKAYLDLRGRLNWTQTLEVFMQIMDALRAVHQAGLLHRDIAPDNIYLCGDGRVKLLDFGAAQASLAGNARQGGSHAVLVKSGFAPEEQYRDDSRQGPWSDVYSLAASMYFCLAGIVPPDALDRLKQDQLKPLADFGVAIPPRAEQVLLDALAVDSLQRPQSMETLQQQFLAVPFKPVSGRQAPITAADPDPATRSLSLSVELGKPAYRHWRRWLLAGAVGLLLVMLWGGGERRQTPGPTETLPQDAVLPAEHGRTGLNEQTAEEQWALQRIRERQAAEQLKQQQEAALKRFEERRRQEAEETAASSGKQAAPQHSEHMRSLCAEWGATMECQALRKSQ